MRTLFASLLFISGFGLYAQDMQFGLKIMAGNTLARIDDDDARPSSEYQPADGNTFKVENEDGYVVTFTFDYALSSSLMFSSGLGFSEKELFIRNVDGNYSGTSVYSVGYLQIPINLRYVSEDVVENLRISAYGGPFFELKHSENLETGDGAHFWNMAYYRTDLDPTRGRNGAGEPVDLFANGNLGFNIGAEAQYAILPELFLFMGLEYQHGFSEMINNDLTFDNPSTTRVDELLEWRASILGISFGATYRFN